MSETTDLLCRNCKKGYGPLKGYTLKNVCPECATDLTRKVMAECKEQGIIPTSELIFEKINKHIESKRPGSNRNKQLSKDKLYELGTRINQQIIQFTIDGSFKDLEWLQVFSLQEMLDSQHEIDRRSTEKPNVIEAVSDPRIIAALYTLANCEAQELAIIGGKAHGIDKVISVFRLNLPINEQWQQNFITSLFTLLKFPGTPND